MRTPKETVAYHIKSQVYRMARTLRLSAEATVLGIDSMVVGMERKSTYERGELDTFLLDLMNAAYHQKQFLTQQIDFMAKLRKVSQERFEQLIAPVPDIEKSKKPGRSNSILETLR